MPQALGTIGILTAGGDSPGLKADIRGELRLICLGGNGTRKNAYRLQKAGMQVNTLPKTTDRGVAETDITFG